jgi:uncharacterized protein YkwD
MKSTLRVLAIFVLGLCLASSTARAQTRPSSDEMKLFNLLNQERERAGLQRLQWDYHLAESARFHAQQMVQHRELSHMLPGEPDMGERIAATGIRFDAIAENVAYAPTVESAHQGLMNSPPHRTNIMNPQYDAVGVAVISSGRELYVAQNFAHALPPYTETQFRNTMLLAFNQARRSKGLGEMKVVFDEHLQQAACSGQPDPHSLIAELPGAANVDVFTASSPVNLPDHMHLSATDSRLHRMNVGVCFKPGREQGYASFTVVAAFFHGD